MDILKSDFLDNLRSYTEVPDDESIQYKEKIKKTLLNCPELLYALHEKELESELFVCNENNESILNIDQETGELLGEVDRYFGENNNIRPYLFMPETQTNVKHYVCYQLMFDEIPRYNDLQKYTQIIFTIFVDGKDREDELTGIPRHDLIASIIREVNNVLVKILDFRVNIKQIYINDIIQEAIFLYFLFLALVNGLLIVSAGAKIR